MSRPDALGLFWYDEPAKPREKAEVIKRSPPARTWEEPGYLPGLAEARAFHFDVMDPQELYSAMQRRDELLFDIEVYRNYFLAVFTSLQTGKHVIFEMYPGSPPLNVAGLLWVVENFLTVGFNSLGYDLPITAMAVAGLSCEQLKDASDRIILTDERGAAILKEYKLKRLKGDHIDLIEVAPLRATLKVYGGRIHAPRMQDLPFHPHSTLSEDQRLITKWYCVNDTSTTAFLREKLNGQLELRVALSNEYRIDLRSKSDAQIAEAVILQEVTKLVGPRKHAIVQPGHSFHYRVPEYLKYESDIMRWTLNLVANTRFVVGIDTGAVGMPDELKDLKLNIAGATYRMGIGGLHSSEKKIAHFETADYKLHEFDVESYYPRTILNQGLYPVQLTPAFLRVYGTIVERRLAAKAAGDKVTADSLKITVNGSFGKLGSPYSILYAPDLLIQVTVSGQLALLMLIERLEWAGITVVSANTDGIMVKCPIVLEAHMHAIVRQWEADTHYKLDHNTYVALYSRDVNNYIGVKTPKGNAVPDIKAKGAYSRPGLSKNPTGEICIDAIEALVTRGIHVEETVRACRDIRKFVTVRTVKGGAVKEWDETRNEYLGKSIRWYYAQEQDGMIVYADSGAKVPNSDGAKPLMVLPHTMPADVDFDKYIAQTSKMLADAGYAY